MRKAFRYKIRLSPGAQRRAANQLRLCCELYNAALQERRDAWRMCRESVGFASQSAQVKDVRVLRPEFAALTSNALIDVVKRVDLAFAAFFRRVSNGERAGYPRFKSARRYDSMTMRQGCGYRLDGDRLHLRNIGTGRLHLSRPVEGTIKTVTLSRDRCGDWFVVFACDDVPERTLPATGSAIGVDLGIEAFLTTSTGERVENPRVFVASERAVRRARRRVARRKRGSHRRRKAARLLAKRLRRQQRARRDFHFKTALALVRQHDTIAVEDLNVRGLSRGILAKHVNDVAWGQFIAILTSKAAEAGRHVIAVDPRGTSQVCSNCGCEPDERKTLAERTHHCRECGYMTHRDHNAARNVLHVALGGRAGRSASGEGSKRAA